jgi:chorismate dehydratase
MLLMEKKMKIGYIDYLNCYPFYYHMFEKEPLDEVTVVPGHPDELNRMMKAGALDLSPVSAAAYAEIQDEALVLPYFCLSSVGYVKSVVLNSKVPIEELSGRNVGLTTASRTSVVLLKILLEKYYGLKPNYRPVDPHPSFNDVDAALVIGNEAMMEHEEPVGYSYDLGDLWLRKTGHPVVFAIFVVSRKAIETDTALVKRIIASYSLSLQELRTDEDFVVSMAGRRYPGIKYDIGHYYELLKFDFTVELKEALRFYYNEAAGLGLITPVEKISFF